MRLDVKQIKHVLVPTKPKEGEGGIAILNDGTTRRITDKEVEDKFNDDPFSIWSDTKEYEEAAAPHDYWEGMGEIEQQFDLEKFKDNWFNHGSKE